MDGMVIKDIHLLNAREEISHNISTITFILKRQAKVECVEGNELPLLGSSYPSHFRHFKSSIFYVILDLGFD